MKMNDAFILGSATVSVAVWRVSRRTNAANETFAALPNFRKKFSNAL